MFKLDEIYEVDRRILKCEYIRYSPAATSTANTPISQMYINTPGEDSVTTLLNIYLDLSFDIIKKADKSIYGSGIAIRLVNLGLFGLLSIFKLSTSSGKHLEDIIHAYCVSSMYKLITSAKGSDDLSIAFYRNC